MKYKGKGQHTIQELEDMIEEQSKDKLVLLERMHPTIYEVHKNEIRREKNLIFSTHDFEFAKKIVNAYNNYRQ